MSRKRLSKSQQRTLQQELSKTRGGVRGVRRVARAPRAELPKRVRDVNLTDRFRTVVDTEDAELTELAGERIRRRAPGQRKDGILRKLVVEQAQQLAAQQPRHETWRKAIVTQLTPQGCVVDDGGRPVDCFVRGSLKELLVGAANPVAVGDRVWYQPQPEGTGAVEDVEPRQTKLSRPTPHSRHRENVIVANVDQLVIISSVAEPDFRGGLVDRYLVAAELNGMDAAICVNKIDLADDEHPLPKVDFYAGLGYRMLFTSVPLGRGIDELCQLLAGRTTVLAGHSGTGKSSLINLVQPGLNLKIGDITASSKGRHTTTSVTLLPLAIGGYVVDTPGVREFGLWDLHREELDDCFVEMAALAEQCQMHDCTHIHEPSCAVKAAVEAGQIAPERYDSYVAIYGSLPSGAPYRYQP